MAWNGRNVSILGAKAEVKDAASADGDVAKKTQGDAADAIKKPAPPPPSVWNGRHKKIIPAAVPASETSSVASGMPARSPSPASTTSSVSKALKELVVISPPKDDIKSVPKEKEDETTNSTAGSSIKSIDNEDVGAGALEVKVVTTTTMVSEKKDDGNDTSSEANVGAKTAAAFPALSNRPKNQKNNNARRPGNKGNNSNGNNNQAGNTTNKQNYSRGGSTGSGRRRANINIVFNNNNHTDKPSCSFYMRGSCNRGDSCEFKHDRAHAPSEARVAAPSRNSPVRRSGTHPPAKSGTHPPARNGSTHPPARNGPQYRGPQYRPSKRAFDPNKALAIKLVREAQDKEDRSSFASPAAGISSEIIKGDPEEALAAADPPLFSIDVECIATGHGSCAKGINDGCGNEGRSNEGAPPTMYNDRSHRYPGRVAVVDTDGAVLADILVRPPKDGAGVVSYLTPLTGLTSELCLGDEAVPLEEAVATVRSLLPVNAVLVGQAIDHDVEWLGLVPGKDFGRMLDISEIFRQRMPSVLNQASDVLKAREEGRGEQATSEDPSSDAYLGFATRYRHFSLRHVCVNLLDQDIQNGVHDPVIDARYSLLLFHKYRNSSVTQLRIVRDGLHRAPITPSFASEYSPVVDGVCVSAAAYPYKRAARKIWMWYAGRRGSTIQQQETQES